MAGLGARINATLAQAVADFQEVGLAAAVDPAQVAVPGAWLSPREVLHGQDETLDGALQLVVHVYLIGPAGAGTVDTLAHLGDLLDQALEVVDPDASTSTAEGVVLPSGPDPLPAYRLTVHYPV